VTRNHSQHRQSLRSNLNAALPKELSRVGGHSEILSDI
jgi:hypothetical protein